MKKLLYFLLLLPFLGCNDSGFNNRNPYLPNYNFSYDINTNLPSFSNLQFPSNAVKIYPGDGPSRGIIVFNTGSTYNAFDGGCPNQDLTSCSTLTINGIEAKCPCDDASYNLFTGQYRVEVSGTNIRVYN
jgi:nitrite reductase/ring-hydroxylating ferredoxin subunit